LALERVASLAEVSGDSAPDLLVVHAAREELSELFEVLDRLRASAPGCITLVFADDLTQQDIASLFGAGIHDFASASAPLPELLARTQRAVDHLDPGSAEEIRSLVHPKVKGIVGSSPVFLRELAKLPVLAGCDAGVLILGETGTGKEVLAQAVHYSSARASRPWVAVNCGAIPSELMENELFGHARGAYTGAHAPQSGLVREAEGGTLFLDEIDSLPYDAQAKLLRFVQTREFRPVGCSTVQYADVRIIAASNQSLEARVEAGRFRRDLYYRLNVLTLTLPPLRERREDIAALAQHFLRHFALEYGREVIGIQPAALRRLVEREWPGNVRELQHAVERAVLMAQGPKLTQADFEPGRAEEVREAPESFRKTKQRVVANFERDYLDHLLSASGGNITSAARAAKKNRRALFELIRKHKIDPDRYRASPTR
jgi:two-component system response regulator GlrR